MRSVSSRAALLLSGLGLALACGGSEAPLFSGAPGAPGDSAQGQDPGPTTVKQSSSAFAFPGAGTSGAAEPLNAGLGPESRSACDPSPALGATAETPVQHVCFYTEGDAAQPAATIEQVVEVVGTESWVHLRLTLNPDFVDNTYGQTALGWGNGQASEPAPATGAAPPPTARRDGGAAPPAPPDAPSARDGAKPPAPGETKPPRGNPAAPAADAGPPPDDAPTPPDDAPAPPDEALTRADAGPSDAARTPPQPGGHTFRDLVGSDHAEIQLLDASGKVAMEFWLDYLSPSDAAPSGYASLGVTGGEGRLKIGDPAWILATTSSMDRNLNACGLGGFTSDSPETDENYTPNPEASDWDYRVSYEAWISTAAFGGAGFGSALIQLVHASPSKQAGDSLNVTPAPCPADPERGELTPEPLPPVLSTIR